MMTTVGAAQGNKVKYDVIVCEYLDTVSGTVEFSPRTEVTVCWDTGCDTDTTHNNGRTSFFIPARVTEIQLWATPQNPRFCPYFDTINLGSAISMGNRSNGPQTIVIELPECETGG